ncbi:helix-turn-helix domain-containing protein [Chitinophaga sp. NPDC101104]|uniref:helix-turn-helix domain-containing protein n=1 Tax=Chitinophaga sp. NPDC101104 TaxID=3390561 RepID=UPI003D075BEE
MEVGKAIVAIRAKLNMKATELANKIGISKTALSQIETGKARPNAATLKKIAEAFGTDVSFIYLAAIDPDKDISQEKRKLFNELFPDFHATMLSFIDKDQQ